MKSLLDGVTPQHINNTPFPHVFIPDVMDAATAKALGGRFSHFLANRLGRRPAAARQPPPPTFGVADPQSRRDVGGVERVRRFTQRTRLF